jgi:hypothetical protein
VLLLLLLLLPSDADGLLLHDWITDALCLVLLQRLAAAVAAALAVGTY